MILELRHRLAWQLIGAQPRVDLPLCPRRRHTLHLHGARWTKKESPGLFGWTMTGDGWKQIKEIYAHGVADLEEVCSERYTKVSSTFVVEDIRQVTDSSTRMLSRNGSFCLQELKLESVFGEQHWGEGVMYTWDRSFYCNGRLNLINVLSITGPDTE